MKRIQSCLAIATVLIAGSAQADTRCAVPMTEWQPRDAVARLAAENGWLVRRIKIDDGCYEVIGTDAKGRRLEVKVHPGTLAVVEREYGDDEGDHNEGDDDEGDNEGEGDHDDQKDRD